MSRNLFWSDVLDSDVVDLMGRPGLRAYRVTRGDLRFVVYWTWRESKQAQRKLDAMVEPTDRACLSCSQYWRGQITCSCGGVGEPCDS